VAAPSARTARASRTALLLWFFPPLFELAGVLLLCAGFEEVARVALFGSPGTEIVTVVVMVILVVGTVLAWRGVSGVVRTLVAAALFVSAGLVGALFVGFLVGGTYVVILSILMAHSAAFIALIGGAVLRSTPTEGR
jgi:hypothetical protein